MSVNSHSDRVEIGLFVIRSDDMHSLAAFYSAIGLSLVKHDHPPCGEHYSTVDGSCVFEICQRKANQGTTTDIFFGLNVPSVDRAVESAMTNQGTVVRSPEDSEWGRTAIIRDLDGHRVMLIERN
jgi:hypothetical protein